MSSRELKTMTYEFTGTARLFQVSFSLRNYRNDSHGYQLGHFAFFSWGSAEKKKAPQHFLSMGNETVVEERLWCSTVPGHTEFRVCSGFLLFSFCNSKADWTNPQSDSFWLLNLDSRSGVLCETWSGFSHIYCPASPQSTSPDTQKHR